MSVWEPHYSYTTGISPSRRTNGNNILKEFKAFISRGIVIDLAVGIIVGAEFTAIIRSVVGDLINPIIGLFMGGIDFANLYIPLTTQNYATFEEFNHSRIGILAYGQFLMVVINFFVVAIVVFPSLS